MVVSLPDGRSETRDVACSIERDPLEVTIEYSDILDDGRSVTSYQREADDGRDVTFVFQDPEPGGLRAGVPEAAREVRVSDARLEMDLDVLVVATMDDRGDSDSTVVGLTGTCSA